jgi:NAD(P)H-hydrate epimerase
MKISRVSEMQAMDQAAIQQYGITEELLMENAGLAVCTVLSQEIGVSDKRFLVFCGTGNNGGDGFVIARKLFSDGAMVQVYLLGEPQRLGGAARIHLDILRRFPIAVCSLTSADAAASALRQCDVVVDALFGTGLTREVAGVYRDVITLINTSGKVVVSVDIPSGVQGDTGRVMGTAVQAHYTVTFGLPKPGNLLYPGYTLCGKLYVSHISFPPQLYTNDALKIALNEPLDLPPRSPTGHKGSFGDVLFIAGAASYYGAPLFAALAFLKAGGGYARLAAPAAMTPFLATEGREIVFVPQQETTASSVAYANKPQLLDLAARADMVVLGPGLSLDVETQQLARELVSEIRVPLLLDGDGITAVCADLDRLRAREAETILTPHLGEMARLTSMTVSEIEADKIPVLQRTARDLGGVIVLKGAHSLIGYPDQRVFVNMSGNSGMATPGSGDVLTGTVAAMYGLGLPVGEAVRQGVFIHGLAGDLAAAEHGEDGLLARDILASLPRAMQGYRDGLPVALRQRYQGVQCV